MNEYKELKEEYGTPEDYLYSLQRKGVKLGLDKIRDFLSNFGDPQEDYDKVLIAGTNGKGSVTTMVSDILKEAGYKTGRFISPHLCYFGERITVNGEMITDDQLWELISEVKPVLEHIDEETPEKRPSFFEVLTSLAFMHYSDQDIDVAVLEVGMGGRLDATNISKHKISAVTTIGIDHSKYLGSTKEQIAFEKAGIIKRGNYFVTGEKEEDLVKYFKKVCDDRRAFYHHALDREYEINTDPLTLTTPEYGDIKVPGIAEWQAENALVAVGIIEGLRKKGYEISDEVLKSSLENTTLPARMETVTEKPWIMMDSAHNPAGMEALKEALATLDHDRLLLVIGVLEDKDHERIVKTIGPEADKVFTAEPVSKRKLDSHILAEEFSVFAPTQGYGEGIDALEAAKEEWKEGDLIMVTGSIYLLGDIRRKM
ncbi:MAG: bifunctional folylpolyglutamate synthase/dihydrofolate synthase [Thermoplasmatota archaeon]